MRRLLTVLVVLGVCASAVVLAGASGGSSKEKRTVKVVFDNAFGLVQGGEFRVANVEAGATTKFGVVKAKGKAPKALVTAEITQPGFGEFRKDASCEIAPQSLIGEYYVDCQPGSSPEKLPNGGTIPVEQTSSTIPQDLVSNIMRRPYRERFRLILTELGTGLAGRPKDLQEVLRRAHPGLRETSKVLRILGNQNKVIEDFIENSDTVVAELERNKKDVVRFVKEAGDAAEITATRRDDLARTFERLPTFLDELRPTMRRLGDLSEEQVPLLTDVERAAPSLNTFLTRLGPFSQASRPAIRSLGASSVKGTRAFREGRQEVRELNRLADEAPAFAKPLRQFLEATDDRKRAVEVDPRAKVTSPPAPDPTAIKDQGGFTAFEGLVNFFFWQTLSVNLVDNVGHMLRNGLTLNDCSELTVSPPKTPSEVERFRRCNQYLGPSQPGITGLPGIDGRDVVSGPAGARQSSASRRDTPARRRGERRAPGEPDAKPVPGQPDVSKPRVVLPPSLQGLLDQLPKSGRVPKAGTPLDNAPGAGRGTAGDGTELLDYLFSP